MIINATKPSSGCTIYKHIGNRSVLIKDYHREHVLVEVFNGEELIGENVLRHIVVKSLEEAKAFLESVLQEPIEIIKQG